MKTPWQPYWIETPSLNTFTYTLDAYREMTLTVLDTILTRFDADPDYPFIDTKLDILTGNNFGESDGRGRSRIFGWIQGRGIEALAEHASWLCREFDSHSPAIQDRLDRISVMLNILVDQMETLRDRNGGSLYFCMDPRGTPLGMSPDGRVIPQIPQVAGSSFTDLFYGKGLVAAGNWLQQADWVRIGRERLSRVFDDIETGHFVSDQQSFDSRNPRGPEPEGEQEGPWMIAIGALALLMEKTSVDEWQERATRFIHHLFEFHVNTGEYGNLETYDFIETLHEGAPAVQNGHIICNPGHGMEFIGLGVKVLRELETLESLKAETQSLIEHSRSLMPALFLHLHELGYQKGPGGFPVSVDLLTRKPVNSVMPWWPLPEAMRAGVELIEWSSRDDLWGAVCDYSNSFLHHYVNPDVYLMAYQSRDAEGQPVAVVPATPDADPGYHTGLSVIDVLDTVKRLCGSSSSASVQDL
jgi:mannose/cellobiose epimerase-like protein (N-acyl-D-glucosamine 2-epimerase family)